jgi:hypothetical protein
MADDTPSDPAGAEDAGVAPATSGGGRRGGVVVVGLLVLAVVAAVVLAAVQRGRAEDLDGELSRRDDVARAASTFGEVYLTYDFDDPDRSGDRVLELVSPDFANEFTDTRAPGIEELFANLKTTTEATTTEVFVGDVSDDAARALVVVDVVAESSASGRQELSDLSFVLDLVRVDGAWLVDDVTPAPQPDLSGDGVEQPGATTTTAPAPTTTAAP